jgi:ATP-dependent DNA helicase RecG
MREEARKHKCPEPQFAANGFFTATFWPTTEGVHGVAGEVGGEVAGEVGGEVGPYAMKILKLCVKPQPMRVIGEAIGIGKWDNLKPHLAALIKAGWLEMTIPDKLRSSKQRYRSTELGLKALGQRKEEK